MDKPPKYRKPLPKRFSAAVSEDAYAQLRRLAGQTGLSNNYVLTALLEFAPDLIDDAAFGRAVERMLEEARVK